MFADTKMIAINVALLWTTINMSIIIMEGEMQCPKLGLLFQSLMDHTLETILSAGV